MVRGREKEDWVRLVRKERKRGGEMRKMSNFTVHTFNGQRGSKTFFSLSIDQPVHTLYAHPQKLLKKNPYRVYSLSQ